MITVIFSTHNGQRTLPRMLEAFSQVVRPASGAELIAVDNASTDDSANILRTGQDKGDLKVLHQPLRGKNRALNLAISSARGELVVLTDDDVVPDPKWLIALEAAAERRPEADIFGGTIFPVWERSPPDWVLKAVPQGVTFALTAPGLAEGPIHPGLIWGPNMMVRRRIFDLGYRFNEGVGPSAGQYMMGSETEFNIRVAHDGYKTWFCPEARVGHIIRDFQISEDWVVRRAYRFGRNKCHQDFNNFSDDSQAENLRGLLNFPRWMLRKIATETLLSFTTRITGKKAASVAHSWEASFLRGYIAQAMALKRLSVSTSRQ